MAPLVPGGFHDLHLLRVSFGKVIQLGAIDAEIVEFPRLVIEGDEFPVSFTDGAMALVLEEKSAFRPAVVELINQIDAL